MSESNNLPDAQGIDHSTDTTAQPTTQVHSITFHGEGAEYFRIWVVNTLLTIVTLGIYSAWAKVRTNRYFYGNTLLADDAFEYLAEPMQILKGRLIAIGVLVVYVLVQTFWPVFTWLLVAVLLCFLPFIVVRSLRFRAIMSSWRGIRFDFAGDTLGAAQAFVFWPLFGLATLGFGMPLAWYKQNQYVVGNHKFGQTDAHSSTRTGDFYNIFWTMFGLAAVASAVVSLASLLGTVNAATTTVVAMLIFFLYVSLYAVYQAMHYRLAYDNIVLGDTRTRSDVVLKEWVGIVVLNSVLLVLTLGLFYPWARVWLSRYMVAHTQIESADLAAFAAREGDDQTATGEEIGEAFDLGIGI